MSQVPWASTPKPAKLWKQGFFALELFSQDGLVEPQPAPMKSIGFRLGPKEMPRESQEALSRKRAEVSRC